MTVWKSVGLDLEDQGYRAWPISIMWIEETLVIADAEQMKRVINNIIGNSVKYMDKQKGYINICVSRMWVILSRWRLRTTERALPTKDLPYIFDRFYRTDASRNSRTGRKRHRSVHCEEDY